jgi:hypothetical protein
MFEVCWAHPVIPHGLHVLANSETRQPGPYWRVSGSRPYTAPGRSIWYAKQLYYSEFRNAPTQETKKHAHIRSELPYRFAPTMPATFLGRTNRRRHITVQLWCFNVW